MSHNQPIKLYFCSASLPQEDEVGEEKPSQRERKNPQREEKSAEEGSVCDGDNSSKYRGFWNTLSVESTDPLSSGVWSSRLRPHPTHTPAHPGKTPLPPSPKSCYITFQKHVWRNSGGYPDPPPDVSGPNNHEFYPPSSPAPLLSCPLYKSPLHYAARQPSSHKCSEFLTLLFCCGIPPSHIGKVEIAFAPFRQR